MARRIPAALAELGLTLETEDLYWRLHARDGQPFAEVALALGFTEAELQSRMAPLERLGVVRVDRDLLRLPPTSQVLTDLVTAEVERVDEAARRLRALASTIPLALAPAPQLPRGEEALSGFRATSLPMAETLARWIDESTGEMLVLRTDHWHQSAPTPALTEAWGRAMAAGRTSRAIYPVRALEEAPQLLAERARAGEQVRVLADVPHRLFVIPTTHALVPCMPGQSDKILVVHERGLVIVLQQYFERLWERAVPVPELDMSTTARERGRRMLLQQLAAGGTDERISRTLGVSIRTVRRRVADLMIELGTDSRFQAGVEAVRRGWL